MNEQTGQVEYFVILTIQYQQHPGAVGMSTITRTITPKRAVTREELYAWALQQVPAQARGGNVVFFSAEPNHQAGQVAR